ncbi:MAG: hypothetical protein GXP38_09705 [Chloroflexi bacterium]|nr:hypothetical protein [Chloroflexota bacterium]
MMTLTQKTMDRLGTMALALILAIIVWVVAQQQENPLETTIITDIPVSVRNMPEDLVPVEGASYPSVEVRVRAPRSILATLTRNSLNAFIDLATAQPGRQEVPVQIDSEAPNVDILDISPPAIVVRLERRISRQIPVIANILDSPPFGYVAGSAVVTPTIVTVSGPESLVNLVRRAEVSVRLLDARSDVHVTDFVTLRNSSGAIVTGLEVDPRTVTVEVPITQQQGVREESVRPRFVGQPAPNYIVTGVSADPATITLFGDPDVLDALPPFVETIPINIDGAVESIEERVPVIVPEHVSIMAAQAVKVRIDIEPLSGSATTTLHPIVQGLAPDLQITNISPESIDVLLLGPLPRLLNITADLDVQAVLQLSNLGPGVYTITPIMVLPEGVTAQTILPEAVQVTIERKPTATPTLEPQPQPPHLLLLRRRFIPPKR